MNLKSLIQLPFLMLTLLVGQEESPFTRFDVYIYPEYDHPGVGVFIEGALKADQYPRYTEINVPAATTMALLRKGEQTQEAERIELKERDGKKYLPLDLSESRFQVQFYFDPFDDASPHRKFSYELATNEQLPEWHLVLQQPLGAEAFIHSLSEPEVINENFGLKFFRMHKQGLKPGEAYTLNVSYNNPTGILTIDRIRPMMEQQQAQGSGGAHGQPGSNMLTVLMGFVLLGVAIFALVKYFGPGSGAGVKTAVASGAKTTVKTGGKAIYCSNCGTEIRAGAKFCSGCGKGI